MTGVDSMYGVLIIRGLAGFKIMRDVASNYAKQCRWLADLGLGLSFGSIYHYFIFKKDGRRLLLQQLLIIVFFAGFFLNQQNPGSTQSWIILLLGLASGFFGLGIFWMAKQALDILTITGTPPGVALLIPGVTPGIPLYEGIIAIVIIASVHELAHGVLANIEKLPLKSSGALLWGFLPIGAFVEPDEKAFGKLELHKKRRVLIAGSTSNLFFFIIFSILLALAGFALNPLVSHAEITAVAQNGSANGILAAGNAIYSINAIAVKNLGETQTQLAKYKEGNKIILSTSTGEKQVVLGKNGKMGVEIKNKPLKGWELPYEAMVFIMQILFLTMLLNFMLAIVNVLPLFLTDGHKLLNEELTYWLAPSTAQKVSVAIGIAMLAIVALNALPYFI